MKMKEKKTFKIQNIKAKCRNAEHSKTLYFCHGVAAWAGTGLFECLKDASKT